MQHQRNYVMESLSYVVMQVLVLGSGSSTALLDSQPVKLIYKETIIRAKSVTSRQWGGSFLKFHSVRLV
jgi:hypothetical protein